MAFLIRLVGDANSITYSNAIPNRDDMVMQHARVACLR